MIDFFKRIPGEVRLFWYERKREIIFCVIIFLAASFSFGLGYVVRRDYSYAPIIIEKCSSNATSS